MLSKSVYEFLINKNHNCCSIALLDPDIKNDKKLDKILSNKYLMPS